MEAFLPPDNAFAQLFKQKEINVSLQQEIQNLKETIRNLETEVIRNREYLNKIYGDYYRPYKRELKKLDKEFKKTYESCSGRYLNVEDVVERLYDCLSLRQMIWGLGNIVPKDIIMKLVLNQGYKTDNDHETGKLRLIDIDRRDRFLDEIEDKIANGEYLKLPTMELKE